jgi:4-hydroxy-3-polyprenylbenzoate decarboxylase
VTGATGAVYAVRLLERLRSASARRTWIVSTAGVLNVASRAGARPQDSSRRSPTRVARRHRRRIASGSASHDAMVVVPVLDEDAGGDRPRPVGQPADRAADVTLKERAPPRADGARDAVNLRHLRNMTPHRDGPRGLSAAAGFLPPARSIDEMVAKRRARAGAARRDRAARARGLSGL